MNFVLLALGAYIALQLVIGAVVSRRIHSEDDYLLAGRSLGYRLATFSIFATWFGAETCVDAAGRVYADGLSYNSTEPFAYGVAMVLTGLLIAVPLHRARVTTLADFYRQRFSGSVERLAALVMIPSSVFWAAAQIRAFGHVLASASGVELEPAMLIAAGVVVVYTVFGGLLADAITDLVQGFALIVGLVAMLIGIASDFGGLASALDSIDLSLIKLRPEQNAGWLSIAESWALPILGSFVAQELLQRVCASRTHVVAQRSTIAAGVAYTLVGSIPVALGLIAASNGVLVDDAEQVLPHLARERLSTLGYVLFAGALVSAILSTVDSTLLVAASLFSRNLVGPLLPSASDASKIRIARIGVGVFGLLALALAFRFDSVGELIDITNGFGSAGLLVILMFGLYSRIGGPRAALAALVLGVVVYLATALAQAEYVYLPAVGAALAGYLLVAPFERRTSAA
ncbi:MAG: sodium:solute symporter family protein [Planctomycetes bacterium]|nr:sodium:solute symporter family protein [Planctomycetota bacterium]